MQNLTAQELGLKSVGTVYHNLNYDELFAYETKNNEGAVSENGTMMVDLTDAGYGSPKLDLGNGVGFSGELKYTIIRAKNSSFQFGAQFKTWEFGRSNSKTISNGINTITITEPDSTTMQTILSASYIHRF